MTDSSQITAAARETFNAYLESARQRPARRNQMSPFGESDNRSNERATVARAEIETMCILEAIPAQGCELSVLPETLGLAPTLLSPVTAALEPLLASGWIEISDGRVQMTSAGRSWLDQRKLELEV